MSNPEDLENRIVIMKNRVILCSKFNFMIFPLVGFFLIFLSSADDEGDEKKIISSGIYIMLQLLICCAWVLVVVEFKSLKLRRQTLYPNLVENGVMPRQPPSILEIPVPIERITQEQRDYQDILNQQNPDKPQCLVCMENVRSVKLNCGHSVLCHICAHQIENRKQPCPICREVITNIKEEVFSDNDYSPSNSGTPPTSDSPFPVSFNDPASLI